MTHKVSHINATPIADPNGYQIASISFILDDHLFLNGITIVKEPIQQLRIIYPTQTALKQTVPIFKPTCKVFAAYLQDEIIRQFKNIYSDVWNSND